MLGPLALLALAVTAFLYIVGARTLGRNLLLATILLAILATLFSACIAHLGASLAGILLPLLGLALLIITVAGIIRYVKHRRQLQRWQPEEPTSRKLRVDRWS